MSRTDCFQFESFTATTILPNGASLGLTGYLFLQPSTFIISPDNLFTTDDNSFKFALDISNWQYVNKSGTRFLELRMLVTLGGTNLAGGFLEEDKNGIFHYTLCTTTSCSSWQIPTLVFIDSVTQNFTHSVSLGSSSASPSTATISFKFPVFSNTLVYDPDFTLSASQTQFSYSSSADSDILLLVAIFIPVFCVAITVVIVVALALGKLQGNRFIAEIPEGFGMDPIPTHPKDEENAEGGSSNEEEELDGEKEKEADEGSRDIEEDSND